MELISKIIKVICFLLSIIDIYSNYAWALLLKDKNGILITNAFPKLLYQSNRKSDRTWLDRGSEFFNRSMKSWLQNNDVEMCSTHHEGKSVVDERFVTTFKNKIYKLLTSVSKDAYINKLDDIVNKYNNAYHITIKMKPVDVKSTTYIDFIKGNNKEEPKFEVELVIM